MIDYTLRLADPFGRHLRTFGNFGTEEGSALNYVLSSGRSSALVCSWPRGQVDESLFQKDARLTPWRSIHGRTPIHDNRAVYLVRKRQFSHRYFMVTAYHTNSLWDRRNIGYDKTSTFSDKNSVAADNLIKDVWEENFGASISSARDGGSSNQTGADLSSYVTVQADQSLGQSVSLQIGRRQASGVVQEICEASTQAGTYIAAEIRSNPASSTGGLILETFAGARGVDRRAGTSSPVILSEETETLADMELVEDWTDEVTAAIAVGAGDDDLRLTQIALDTPRIGESPFGRIETIVEASNVSEDAQLLSLARARLREGLPLVYITGKLRDGVKIRGVHYDLGDMVTAKFEGVEYGCRLDLIHIYIGHNNREEQIVVRSPV